MIEHADPNVVTDISRAAFQSGVRQVMLTDASSAVFVDKRLHIIEETPLPHANNIALVPSSDLLEEYATDPRLDTFIISVSTVPSKNELHSMWRTVLDFSIAHVGLNPVPEDTPIDLASKLNKMLSQEVTETPGAFFVGTLLEVLKIPFLGTFGHIALNTPRPEAAEAYLRAQGFTFREETRTVDDDGHLSVVYLEQELGGFAWHLRRC